MSEQLYTVKFCSYLFVFTELRDKLAFDEVTGNEFNMFTKGGQRLIIKGNRNIIDIVPEMYKK